jgi:hypothetical protein
MAIKGQKTSRPIIIGVMNSNDNAGFFVMVNLSLLNSGALPDRVNMQKSCKLRYLGNSIIFRDS